MEEFGENKTLDMSKILLVEDDTTFSAILEGYLTRNGYKVDPFYSVKSALQALVQKKYDLLLLDYRLGDGNCLEIIDALHEKNMVTPAIVMTGFSDVRIAVTAMKKGVYDFITKPVNPDELLMIVQESLKDKRNEGAPVVSENLTNKLEEVKKPAFPEYIEGKSKLANKLHEYIQLVAPTDMSILIRGESGTGKEYVARSIHYTNALMLELNGSLITSIGEFGIGWESRLSRINSSNIGKHQRDNHGVYAEYKGKYWGKFAVLPLPVVEFDRCFAIISGKHLIAGQS